MFSLLKLCFYSVFFADIIVKKVITLEPELEEAPSLEKKFNWNSSKVLEWKNKTGDILLFITHPWAFSISYCEIVSEITEHF